MQEINLGFTFLWVGMRNLLEQGSVKRNKLFVTFEPSGFKHIKENSNFLCFVL